MTTFESVRAAGQNDSPLPNAPAGLPVGYHVIRPGPDRRMEAIEQLLAVRGTVDRAHSLRFVEHARSSEISLDLLWTLEDSTGQLVASVLVVPNPGRTAMVFATAPYPQAGVDAVGSLIGHSCSCLDPRHVVLAQSLLDPSDILTRNAFQGGGFSTLAMLSYMERHTPGKREVVSIDWPPDTVLRTYEPNLEADFLAVLDRSYVGTLDCPDLCGRRPTPDILEGHRRTGRHESALWTLLTIGGQPMAVLLLNPSPATNSIELVYLGLDPGARGQGVASRLLKHGLNLLAGRPERTVNLAVDERNTPALALYRTAGFRTTIRRLAMIRSLNSR